MMIEIAPLILVLFTAYRVAVYVWAWTGARKS